MLKESYIANWKNIKGTKIRVARPSVLSPSEKLLKDYKDGKIDWEGYEIRFRREILNNPRAMEKLREIKELSEKRDIFLMCYEKERPCHRFILMGMIANLRRRKKWKKK